MTSFRHTNTHTHTHIQTHTQTNMWGDVDVVGVSRVHIDDMEANTGAVDDL